MPFKVLLEVDDDDSLDVVNERVDISLSSNLEKPENGRS